MKRLILFVVIVMVATGAFAEGLALGTGHNFDEGIFVEGELGIFRVGAYVNGTWAGIQEPTGTVYFGAAVDATPEIEEEEIDLGEFDANFVARSLGIAFSADLYKTERASFFVGLAASFLMAKVSFETVQEQPYERWNGTEYVGYTNTLTLSGSASGTGFALYPHIGAEARFFDILFVRGKTGLNVLMFGGLDGEFEGSMYDEYYDETSNAKGGLKIDIPVTVSTVDWELEVGVRIPLGAK